MSSIQSKTQKLFYFIPDSIELQNLLDSLKTESLYKVDSDFGYDAIKVAKEFEKSQVRIKIITIRFLTINNACVFDKNNQDMRYGVIYTNGKQYLARCALQNKPGVRTDLEINQNIEEYYKLKQ